MSMRRNSEGLFTVGCCGCTKITYMNPSHGEVLRGSVARILVESALHEQGWTGEASGMLCPECSGKQA